MHRGMQNSVILIHRVENIMQNEADLGKNKGNPP